MAYTDGTSEPEWNPQGPIGLMVAAWHVDPVSTIAMLILAMVFGTAICSGLAVLFVRAGDF